MFEEFWFHTPVTSVMKFESLTVCLSSPHLLCMCLFARAVPRSTSLLGVAAEGRTKDVSRYVSRFDYETVLLCVYVFREEKLKVKRLKESERNDT